MNFDRSIEFFTHPLYIHTTMALSHEPFVKTTTPSMFWCWCRFVRTLFFAILNVQASCDTCFFPAQEPVLPGTYLRARAIGLMPMIDQVRVRVCLALSFSIGSANSSCLKNHPTGREGRQNHCSMCGRPWVPALSGHQRAPPSPSSWNTALLRGLYPLSFSQK